MSCSGVFGRWGRGEGRWLVFKVVHAMCVRGWGTLTPDVCNPPSYSPRTKHSQPEPEHHAPETRVSLDGPPGTLSKHPPRMPSCVILSFPTAAGSFGVVSIFWQVCQLNSMTGFVRDRERERDLTCNLPAKCSQCLLRQPIRHHQTSLNAYLDTSHGGS